MRSIDGSRTLEVRWIHRGGPPEAVFGWLGPFADWIEQREDRYLSDPSVPELGVKIKGGIELDLKAFRGLASGAEFISDAQLESALQEAGVDEATTQAIVDENEQARLDGLRSASRSSRSSRWWRCSSRSGSRPGSPAPRWLAMPASNR